MADTIYKNLQDPSDIDFVITWVDMNDPIWQEQYYKYSSQEKNKSSVSKGLYRDLGTLRYIFRGFEQYTPWVRKIHFVTSGHLPDWLNIEHPKLQIVYHKDILPEKALPTFNACTIEMGLKNINGLAEKFVYFNDDMFMIQKTDKNRFFHNNLPKDFLQVGILYHDDLFSHIIHEMMTLISEHIKTKNIFTSKLFFKTFNVRYSLFQNLRTFLSLIPSKTISRFIEYHHPQPYLKSNLKEACKVFSKSVNKTITNRFLNYDSINQYIFRFWALINNRFYPYNPTDALYVTIDSKESVIKAISKANKKHLKFICFNDSTTLSDDDFEFFTKRMQAFMEKKLNSKSSFEI